MIVLLLMLSFFFEDDDEVLQVSVWFNCRFVTVLNCFFLFFVLEDDDDVVQVFVGGIIPQLTRDPPTSDDIKCYEMLSELGITKFEPSLQGFRCLGLDCFTFFAK